MDRLGQIMRAPRPLLVWLRTGQLSTHLLLWLRLRLYARRLRRSARFDAAWYSSTYPDVAATGMDPALHYLLCGAIEGRSALPLANPALPRMPLTADNYQRWCAARERVAPEPIPAGGPAMAIVLLDGAECAVAASRASLAAQTYQNWYFANEPGGELTIYVPAGTVLAPAALDEIAAASVTAPGAALFYADQDRIDPRGQRCDPWFKPGWDPILHEGCDIVGPTGAYRTALLARLGVKAIRNSDALRQLCCRVVQAIDPAAIRHVPSVLFHTAAMELPPIPHHGKARLGYLPPAPSRQGRRRTPLTAPHDRPIQASAAQSGDCCLVSIIVPTRDQAGLLARCADSILHRTDYPNLELLIVDNGSRRRRTGRLLSRLAADPRVRVLDDPGPFNWSAMNNRAAQTARGDILVLLNNDTEAIHPDWLRIMVSLTRRNEIGVVGARLLYPDGRLQHAGITLGPGAVASHVMRGAARDDPGPGGLLRYTRSVAAVTGACMAMRRAVFEAVGGLEEDHLAVSHNDVDFCLRVRARGWRVICTPEVELYHVETATRGMDVTRPRIDRLQHEREYLLCTWGNFAEQDPYLSPNLTTVRGQLALVPP